MRATVLSGVREFSTVELPEPELGAESVLVRVGAVAICGSDLTGYLGNHPKFSAPAVLGHEFAGTVEAIGADVTAFRVGDRVYVDPTLGCGSCRLCTTDRKNICADYHVMGEGVDLPGGLAGLIAAPQENVHVLDANVSLEAGAIIQPMSVAYHACIDQGQVREGDNVLVFGAGAIGDGILLAAKSVGARVMVVDTLPYRLRVAEELGADVTIDASSENVREIVERETDGFGADVALEAVGGATDEVLNLAIASTGRGGRIVVVGLKIDEARVPIGQLKWQEQTIVGSQTYHSTTGPIVAQRIADGSLPVERLITHRLPFSRVEDAFALLESRAEDVLKVVLHA